MRIALVAANLEPGRDGIGDHCRAMAAALAAAGAEPRLLALADRGVAEPTSGEATLRLPRSLTWPARLTAAKAFLDGAEGVSLQLAPYLYDPRGLLQRVAAPLAALLAGSRLQVTLHETWVGWYATHGWKDRLVGPWQRRGLLALLRRLAPVALDTSLPIYIEQLAAAGLPARLSPMCGSLPVGPAPPGDWLRERLRAAVPAAANPLLVGVFGQHWPGWAPDAALDRLRAAAQAEGRPLLLLLIGRHGASANQLAALRQRHPGLLLVETGEQPPARLAEALNAVAGALAVTPYDLAGKSSSLAACLEFGLPVLTTWGAAPGPAPVAAALQPLVLPPDSDPAVLLRRLPGSGPFRPQAAVRAQRLLADLRG